MKPRRITFLLLFAVSALLFSYLPKPESASAYTIWRSPIESPLLVNEFRQPNSDWSAGHRGVDYLVDQGQKVFAPHEGVVSFAGLVVDRQVLSIRHPDGMISSLEPVCSTKPKGSRVDTGEDVGTICTDPNYVSHCLPRTCLHFSLRASNGYLSPLVTVGGLSPSRLKPWDGRPCSLPSGAQC